MRSGWRGRHRSVGSKAWLGAYVCSGTMSGLTAWGRPRGIQGHIWVEFYCHPGFFSYGSSYRWGLSDAALTKEALIVMRRRGRCVLSVEHRGARPSPLTPRVYPRSLLYLLDNSMKAVGGFRRKEVSSHSTHVLHCRCCEISVSLRTSFLATWYGAGINTTFTICM